VANKIKSAIPTIALVGATFGVLAVFAVAGTVAAQVQSPQSNTNSYHPAPRPDFPGAKKGDESQSDAPKAPTADAATSPRPDFPGAKQGDAKK
jgi:hypothetical protein